MTWINERLKTDSGWADIENGVIVAVRARGNAESDDTTAINEAIAAVQAGGGGVIRAQPGRTFSTSGGHVLPGNMPIWLDFSGTGTMQHTGNNICFNFNPSGTFNLRNRGGIKGIKLQGNSGSSAVGIELGNAWGLRVSGEIWSYSNGVGIDMHNKYNWLEGTAFVGLKVDQCKTGIRMRRTTGTNSFAYTTFRDVSMNVPAAGVGIDFGADSAVGVYYYNATLEANFWLNGEAAAGIRFGPTFTSDTIFARVLGEVPSNATGTNHYSFINDGGGIKWRGIISIKDATSQSNSGSIKVIPVPPAIDSAMGTRSGKTYRRTFTRNIDNQHTGSIGAFNGTDVEGIFVSGYVQDNIFEAWSIPLDGDITNASLVLSVNTSGITIAGSTRLYTGSGSPETVVSANPGSLYMSSAGSLWLKTTGTSNTGWLRQDPRNIGSSLPSLTNGSDDGSPFYHTSWDRPVWWDRFRYRDALGASLGITTVAGSYSFPSASGDDYVRRVVCTGSTGTISLPDPAFTRAGDDYWVKMTGSGTITVNSQGTSKTIDGAASKSLTQWQSIRLTSDGTNWITVA